MSRESSTEKTSQVRKFVDLDLDIIVKDKWLPEEQKRNWHLVEAWKIIQNIIRVVGMEGGTFSIPQVATHLNRQNLCLGILTGWQAVGYVTYAQVSPGGRGSPKLSYQISAEHVRRLKDMCVTQMQQLNIRPEELLLPGEYLEAD